MSEDQGTPTPEDAAAEGSSDESALDAAMDTVNEVQEVADSAAAGEDAQAFAAPELGEAITDAIKSELSMLSDVHMDVRIELGRTRMYVEDVLKLNSGAVVELDKLAGDPVDVFVNDRRVARGEVLVLNDMFCVRINEVVDIAHADT
jgi:flagellar motor switch protein FliN/FliY